MWATVVTYKSIARVRRGQLLGIGVDFDFVAQVFGDMHGNHGAAACPVNVEHFMRDHRKNTEHTTEILECDTRV